MRGSAAADAVQCMNIEHAQTRNPAARPSSGRRPDAAATSILRSLQRRALLRAQRMVMQSRRYDRVGIKTGGD
jgi:hypothetical protein